MMCAVLGAGAEQYRREIGRKSRRGREGNALKGKWTGGRAFGYRVEHGEVRSTRRRPRSCVEIFQRYAGGESPLAIAAALNARRIPSPGSTWKRELRRRGGWVASCIAGDPKRGVGILNCDLYRGRVVWGRSKWIRGVADSKKRRQVQVPESQWIVREDARLRIVPDTLWKAVKARQARQAAACRGAHQARDCRRLEAGRTGPPAAVSCSRGLLTCAVCGANYTMRDAKFVFVRLAGSTARRAATRSASSAKSVERLLLAEIKAGLDLARDRRARPAGVDPAAAPEGAEGRQARVRELEQEVGNLVDAIGKGLLSPAIAARLAAAEAELERLKAPAPDNAPVVALLPRLDELFLARVRELERTAERDPVRARQALVDSIETPIALHPVDGVLDAEIGVRTHGRRAVGDRQECMVAGAGFEPATFGL